MDFICIKRTLIKTINLQTYLEKNQNLQGINLFNTDQRDKMQSISIRKQLKLQTNDSIDKTFKEYAKMISQSVHKLNIFTDNLQSKIGIMLKAQQTQFVTAYKVHMSNIKNELHQMDMKIKDYENKIQFYENQGRLSIYIKKVNSLETQQLKLYEEIKQKDIKIKDLVFQVEMLNNELKGRNQQIKEFYRLKFSKEQKNKNQQKLAGVIQSQNSQGQINTHHGQNKHMSSIQTFTTQIPSHHYNRRIKVRNSPSKNGKITKLTTEDEEGSMLFKSQQYDQNLRKDRSAINISVDKKPYNISVLEKQIHHLKTQNKKLLMFNSKYASNLSQLGEFFLKTVQQLKRGVQIKRRLNSKVTFEQFCREDKLVLVATLLSNQSALMLLYDKIFKPDCNKNRAQSVLQRGYGSKQGKSLKSPRTIEQIMANPQKNVKVVQKIAFPSIKSKRLIF